MNVTSDTQKSKKATAAKPPPSNVDRWLKRETPRVRKALESASRYFDGNDNLTVHTLEAVYAQESSFGTMLRERGSTVAAGHFHLKPDTARRYSLNVLEKNDQRFDIDYASSAAARYLKDLDTMFSEKRTSKVPDTIPVKSASERKKFVLGAYNAGEGRVAAAQQRAQEARKNPQSWDEVETFLEAADTTKDKAHETRQFVEKILSHEAELSIKSSANKSLKQKEPRQGTYRCTEGHWVTIDARPVFICD